MEPCVRCPHPRGAHDLTGAGCLLNGCGCSGFLAEGTKREEPATGPRRVCVDVPDGYMVTVSLVPYTPDAVTEPADG